MSVSAESQSYPSLAIVVPVFNEANTIEMACREFLDVAERYVGRAIVLTVDDGSSDSSATTLQRLAAESDLLDYVQHEANRGYGAAVRTGAKRAKERGFEYVAFIDSDLTNPPEDLLKIGELAKEGALYIKGSRFAKGGGVQGVPWRRRFLSRMAKVVSARLFGVGAVDVTNGFRAASTGLYCSWPLHENGFAVIMEEVYWTLNGGVQIATFPTVLRARDEDQRASVFAYTPRLMREYLRYPLRTLAKRHR